MKTPIADLSEAPNMYETENDISEKRRSELNAGLYPIAKTRGSRNIKGGTVQTAFDRFQNLI
jgi:hypothetical protein